VQSTGVLCRVYRVHKGTDRSVQNSNRLSCHSYRYTATSLCIYHAHLAFFILDLRGGYEPFNNQATSILGQTLNVDIGYCVFRGVVVVVVVVVAVH